MQPSSQRCIGHNSRVHVPAVYRWTFALSGNQVLLCESCCAEWRANAAAEPSLAASRITLARPQEVRVRVDTRAAATGIGRVVRQLDRLESRHASG